MYKYTDDYLLQLIANNNIDAIKDMLNECGSGSISSYQSHFWRLLPYKKDTMPFFFFLIDQKKFELLKLLHLEDSFKVDNDTPETTNNWCLIGHCIHNIQTKKELEILEPYLNEAINHNPTLLVDENNDKTNPLSKAVKYKNLIMVEYLLGKFLQLYLQLEGRFQNFFHLKTDPAYEFLPYLEYYGAALANNINGYDIDAPRFKDPVTFQQNFKAGALVPDMKYWQLYLNEMIVSTHNEKKILHYSNLLNYLETETLIEIEPCTEHIKLMSDLSFYLELILSNLERAKDLHEHSTLNTTRKKVNYLSSSIPNNLLFQNSVNILFFIGILAWYVSLCYVTNNIHIDANDAWYDFHNKFPDYPPNTTKCGLQKNIKKCDATFDSIPAIADCNDGNFTQLCTSFAESYTSCHQLHHDYLSRMPTVLLTGVLLLTPLFLHTLFCSVIKHSDRYATGLTKIQTNLALLPLHTANKALGKYQDFVPKNKEQLVALFKILLKIFTPFVLHERFESNIKSINKLMADPIEYKDIQETGELFKQIITEYSNSVKYLRSSARIPTAQISESIEMMKQIVPFESRTTTRRWRFFDGNTNNRDTDIEMRNTSRLQM